MKVNISKEAILIVLLFYIIPVLDTFALLVNDYFPFLVVFRGVVFLIGLYLFFTTIYISKQAKSLILFFILYVFTSIFIHILIFDNPYIMKIEAITFIKLMYFPILFFSLVILYKKNLINHLQIEKIMFFYGILLFISLFLGSVTGYGGEIGGRGTDVEATKGFMIGANEIGIMLFLTIPFFIMKIRKYFSLVKAHIISSILYTIAGIIVFTKSSLMAIFVSFVYFAYSLNELKRIKRILIKLLVLSLIVVSSMYLYVVLTGIIDFFMTTFFVTLFDGDILGFFFRGRQNYIDAIYPQLLENSYNYIILLFGAGEYYIRHISEIPLALESNQGTLFEMDFFDFFAMYGAIGSVIYLYIIYGIFVLSKINRGEMSILFILALVFIHSFMAAHVLFSPQVTTLISLILIYNLMKKDLGI